MKKLYTLLPIVCLFLFLINKTTAQTITAEKKLRIDLREAMGGNAFDYLKEVNFIVFDTDPKAIFGNIDQLEITQEHYIILDRDTKSILIFDKKGKFFSRIEGLKINPQHPSFFSFCYDRDTKTISFNIRDQLFYFDLKGKLLKQEKIDMLHYKGTELYLGNGYFGSYQHSPTYTYQNLDSTAYQLMVFKKNTLEAKYLPYATGIPYDDAQAGQPVIDLTRDAGDKDTLHFTRDYDYKIYRLTRNNLTVPYEFIFPATSSIPENFMTDTLFNGKRQSFFSTNKSIIFKLGNFYTNRDRILFRTITSGYKNPAYLYDLNTAKLISINNIISDESTYFLPITDHEVGGLDFVNHGIIASDGESFYTSYSSGVLFYQRDATKSKKPNYPEYIKAYLAKKENRKGNPVLVQFKLKDRI